MKIFRELMLIGLICLAGEAVSLCLPIPVPGSVLALLILLALLIWRVVKPKHIHQVADFLLKNMAFFFIPAGVGLLKSIEDIKDSVLVLLFIGVVTTMLTFLAAAYTVILVSKVMSRKETDGHEPDIQ